MDTLSDVRAITFDSYTTIVDIDSQASVLADLVDGMTDAGSVSRFWRARNMMYTVIANDIDAYRPFYEIQGLSLRYALESYGYDVPEEVRNEIRRTVYKDRISVFGDVREGMERLYEAGYPLYVVSNGDPVMLDAMVRQAGIADMLEDSISADEVETFKPDVEIYRHTAARTGTPIDRILHVSGGTMRDIWGAKHAGMRTAWVNREEKFYPPEYLGEEPDLIVTDFHDLADQVGA
ncbi:haloacid dehalogenase type II [Halomarina halobia]|uniref:Haloacid dehalogenase type II n=1 Tax=Halomarina halobia TaxID=3033386 RepID=A0ABD6AF23_9EURY|nr:haloacid dehalogenase type II [Halomarina sp. PSR21]